MSDRLDAARRRASRTIVGLNSGTSMDAVDAAVVQVTGSGVGARVRVLAFEMVPLSAALRARLLPAPAIPLEEVCRLHRELGAVFGDAVFSVLSKAGLRPDQVDVIGSHGQTICHLPADSAGPASTLQIGDADVIAAMTGIPVVFDFRAADVAAGGAGAPLMPWLDVVLFGDVPGTLTLNLGGITSLTWLPAGGAPLAFDVGPCNTTLDLLAARMTGGSLAFDEGGRLAASGHLREDLLASWMRHPFFSAPPPKSSGREAFGSVYVDRLIADHATVPLADLLATHTALVGRSIGEAIGRFLDGPVTRVIASGGGTHNPTLMSGIAGAVGRAPIVPLSSLALDPDAKESVLFALLANERIFGLPSNVPRATGAMRAVSLGKLGGF